MGLGAAGYLYKAGYSMEICVAGAILGTTVSSLAAVLYMMVKVHRKYRVKPSPDAFDGWVFRHGRGDTLRRVRQGHDGV